MKAKSITGNSPEEIKSTLLQSLTGGYKPTLSFVFISDKEQIDAVREILNEHDILIFGATATGDFTDSGDVNNSIVILLLDINPEYFLIKSYDITTDDTEQCANKIAAEGLNTFPNPAFIITASHMNLPGESIIKGIIDVAGDGANVIGGIASHDDMLEGGAVFTNDHIRRGLVCLIIDQDKIAVNGLAVSGWKPVGTLKTVTKSEGNRVYTIDDQPAVDLLIKYTGIDVNLDDEMDIFTQLGSTYPLQVQKDEGLPVMKPPIMVNPSDHSIICGGMIPQGSKVRFSLPPDFDVIDTVIESAEKIKSDELPEADALVVFSCIGRFEALGPLVYKEIEGLQSVWNVPMAGFFSFGEFGKTPGGKSDFHGTTCSWVALKEK